MERNAELHSELKKLGFALWMPCWKHCVKTAEVSLACKLSLQEDRMGFPPLMSYALDCVQIVRYFRCLDVSSVSLCAASLEVLLLKIYHERILEAYLV